MDALQTPLPEAALAIAWTSPDPRIRFWHEGDIAHLDVRELLRAGGKPFAPIMSCVAKMKRGDVLSIHAIFEPKPLRAQLEKRGMTCDCQRAGEEHWILTVTA